MEFKAGREPIQIVEIDETVCGLVYGQSPCTAQVGVTGLRKCFNTFGTCQDTQNFAPQTRTLRFCKPFSINVDLSDPYSFGLLWGNDELEWNGSSLLWAGVDAPEAEIEAGAQYASLIPSVESVSTLPTKLNIGGADRSQGPLGRRGAVNVTFNDHPYSDTLTDPYVTERAYNPLERGTFWSKWNARNPFYNGRALRIKEGYVGEDIGDMQTRSYIMERVQGPGSQGKVQITAKDILKLADDRRVQAPKASLGVLSAQLDDSTTGTFTVEGALLSEYDPSGTVRIGDECITYSSVSESGGILTFNITSRATDGTEADSHDEGDNVQQCLRVTNELCWDVIYDLLIDFGGVDPAFIDKAAWDAEGNFWLPQFTITSLITEPTGVNQLIGEICEQCLINIWWDERAQTIRFRAVRAPVEIAPNINDNANIIANSLSSQTKDDERITQLWIYIQQRDPTVAVDETGNYRKLRIRVDADAESENEYGDSRIRRIFARWLESDAQAVVLGARVLDRYRDVPKILTVQLDAKDRELWTGDILNVEHRTVTDDTGQPLSKLYQVISAHETQHGHVVQYELQTFPFTGVRFGFWMDDNAPDYADATEQERLTGGWWSDEDGRIPDDNSLGYEWQ